MTTMTNLKQRGIGLLELMLSLAIIALLLIMATRYYSQAHGSEQVNSAVNTFHAVYAATESAIANDPNGSTSDVSIGNLQKAGLLPTIYGSDGTAVNPWHGQITAAYKGPSGSSTGLGQITITMASVPKTACQAISQSLQQTLSGGDTVNSAGVSGSGGSSVPGCSSTSNTITAVYNN